MFNEIIVKNFTEPTFACELDEANTTIEIGNPVCGDRIRVQLAVEEGTIRSARYQAWGCATSLATGNVFCACVNSRPLSEAVNITNTEIEALLGDLDPSQHHCLEMLKVLFEKLKQSQALAR